MELVLPNGKVLGHRSLNRYYKQNFKPEDVSCFYYYPVCVWHPFLLIIHFCPALLLDPHVCRRQQVDGPVPRPGLEHGPEGEVTRADHAAPRPRGVHDERQRGSQQAAEALQAPGRLLSSHPFHPPSQSQGWRGAFFVLCVCVFCLTTLIPNIKKSKNQKVQKAMQRRHPSSF